jgi:hypothetical protein
VYRRELFNISAVVVGYDFGVTVGRVDAGFVPSQKHSISALHPDQYRQFLGSMDAYSVQILATVFIQVILELSKVAFTHAHSAIPFEVACALLMMKHLKWLFCKMG